LSTPATHLNPEPPRPSWKEEVNQRLAAHKSRRDSAGADQAVPEKTHHKQNTRAALAAARVAARYAKAPSYSQMLAEEARAAVRAAEAASQAALKAQAVAESVLAELESAAHAEPVPDVNAQQDASRFSATEQGTFFDPFLNLERPVVRTERKVDLKGLQIRWESDLPMRTGEQAGARASRGEEAVAGTRDEWREPAANYGEPETVEPVQPIPANLIEFPRELVAARKARPRIAEGPLAPLANASGQLSIFEVDPGAICIEPEPAHAMARSSAPEWSRIRLDAQPAAETAHAVEGEPKSRPLDLAPMSLRTLAAVVDGSLIAAVAVVLALVTAANLSWQPSLKVGEICAVAALCVIGGLYQAVFFTLAEATPGMRYAGIRLCTFDDRIPTREQRRRRLTAMLLSLLPMGLGVLWAIFDDEHLSWHDRLSQTYLR
jgi:uncharacterized RDD family membrane protein YckC